MVLYQTNKLRDGLYRVTYKNICAGFVIKDGRLQECAPILRKNIDKWVSISKEILMEEVHMSLQHKYRPESFEEFFGNEEAITLVQELLSRSEEDLPKAFLLIGPAGCGKTTLAYLIRKEYGCEDEDFLEIDASKERGIDDMRWMVDFLNVVPLAGAHAKKVVLLDEAHGITSVAFEALLKTLEAPPEKCMLILGTTEPSKLKDTIKRRCKTIMLKPLLMRETIDLIDWVLESEDKKPEDMHSSLKKKIHSVSNGSPGVAMEIFDSIINMLDEGDEKIEDTIEALSYGEKAMAEIVQTLIDMEAGTHAKWNKINAVLKHIDTDFDGLRRQILGYLGIVTLNKKNEDEITKLISMADFFTDNFYDSGRTGLIMACYHAVYNS